MSSSKGDFDVCHSGVIEMMEVGRIPVYLSTSAIDFRKGSDGLCMLISE